MKIPKPLGLACQETGKRPNVHLMTSRVQNILDYTLASLLVTCWWHRSQLGSWFFLLQILYTAQFSVIMFTQKQRLLGLKRRLLLNSTHWSSRGPRFDSKHWHDGSEKTLTSIQQIQCPLQLLRVPGMHTAHIYACRQNIHTHKLSIFFKLKNMKKLRLLCLRTQHYQTQHNSLYLTTRV